MRCCQTYLIKRSRESCDPPSRPSPKYDDKILYADLKCLSSDLGEGERKFGMNILINTQHEVFPSPNATWFPSHLDERM